jgi:hypothetical protein
MHLGESLEPGRLYYLEWTFAVPKVGIGEIWILWFDDFPIFVHQKINKLHRFFFCGVRSITATLLQIISIFLRNVRDDFEREFGDLALHPIRVIVSIV